MRDDYDDSAALEDVFVGKHTNGAKLIHVQFDGYSRAYNFSTPRCQQLVITARGLFVNEGQIIAEARSGFWHARDHAFTHWTCPHPVMLAVELSDDSQLEPRICEDGLTARGGMINSGADYIANLRTAGWFCSTTRKPIKRIVIGHMP